MKAIIIQPFFRRERHPEVVGDWRYVAKHEAYIWQGRELLAAEFNEKSDKIIERANESYSLPCRVRLVPPDRMAKAREALAKQKEKKPEGEQE